MGLHLLIVLVCLRVTLIYPVPIYTKDVLNHTCLSMATITSEAWTNQCPKNVNTYLHTYLVSFKTLIGSLFPLLPLRVKCQNHERVPISPISSILVVYVFSSCQDMDHQNRGNRDPLMVLAPTSPLGANRGNRDPLMVSCCILTDYGNHSRDLCL